jgi:hypothetical protein
VLARKGLGLDIKVVQDLEVPAPALGPISPSRTSTSMLSTATIEP